MRVYGTWVDPSGVRHRISGVRYDASLGSRRGEWDSNVLCNGAYIDAEPRARWKVVTCVRCWYRLLHPPQMKDILRGQHADQVIIDEAQNFDEAMLEKIGIFKLADST